MSEVAELPRIVDGREGGALAEGVQEGVAEARKAREAEEKARKERDAQVIQELAAKIARFETRLQEAQAFVADPKNADSTLLRSNKAIVEGTPDVIAELQKTKDDLELFQ